MCNSAVYDLCGTISPTAEINILVSNIGVYFTAGLGRSLSHWISVLRGDRQAAEAFFKAINPA